MSRIDSSKSVSYPDHLTGPSVASAYRPRMGQSFEPILAAAKLGSEWAWAEIYREVAGPITGFLRARGVADAEEAAGDVFFEVSRMIDGFEGDEDAFRTLIFQVAYERMIQDRHSDAPPRSQLADRVLDRIKRDVTVTDESLSAGGDMEAIRQAFELLTQEQRDVLTLRVAAGLSVEQTAQVINHGIETVRSAQREALAKIRRIFPGRVVTS